MNNVRRSDSLKRESRRRTLLCCTTFCLFCFLILFFVINKIFYSHSIEFKNETISLNIIKFHLSLIQCGQSVVRKGNLQKLIEELNRIMKNEKKIFVNENLNEEIIEWLEFILTECFQARQFSIIEQQKPTIIRQIISILRKEFLYIAGFFIKQY
jgi:hypothetical protein